MHQWVLFNRLQFNCNSENADFCQAMTVLQNPLPKKIWIQIPDVVSTSNTRLLSQLQAHSHVAPALHTSVLPFWWAAPGARLQSVQLFKLQSSFQNVALLFGPTEPWQLQNIVGRFLTRAIASNEKDSLALIFAYDQWSKSLRIWNMTKMLSKILRRTFVRPFFHSLSTW